VKLNILNYKKNKLSILNLKAITYSQPLLLYLIICFSCNSPKKIKGTDKQENKIVLGVVENIENGRDGYTAKIKTNNDDIYFALVSIPNIGSIDGYKDFNIKDKVAVKGEHWKLAEDNHITVRKIISTNNDHFEISGNVASIDHGVDGYTVNISGADGETYFATISIPNLGANHAKFKEYQIGETLSIVGELWLLGDELRVTVRDIKQ